MTESIYHSGHVNDADRKRNANYVRDAAERTIQGHPTPDDASAIRLKKSLNGLSTDRASGRRFDCLSFAVRKASLRGCITAGPKSSLRLGRSGWPGTGRTAWRVSLRAVSKTEYAAWDMTSTCSSHVESRIAWSHARNISRHLSMQRRKAQPGDHAMQLTSWILFTRRRRVTPRAPIYLMTDIRI